MRPIPSFKTEKAEVTWWYEHRAQVEADLRAPLCERKTIPFNDVLAQAKNSRLRFPLE
jgi:hypothetical protein